MKLIDDLRNAAEGTEPADPELLSSAADQIEWYRILLQEIADRNRCTCNPKDIEQGRSTPNCRAFLAGDEAREALAQEVQCQGRLARRKSRESYH